MTIPTTYKRNTTGGAFTAAKVGGVALGINSATDTSNGQPITATHTLRDTAIEGRTRRNVVIAKTGHWNGAYNAQSILSGGTFAYEQVAFMIRTVATTINGSANNALLFAASAMRRAAKSTRQKSFGVKILTAWRNRGWQPLGISGQRSNWDATATGVNTNGILDQLADTYEDGSGGAASDDALNNHTSGALGELTYQYGGTSVNQDEYAARTLV